MATLELGFHSYQAFAYRGEIAVDGINASLHASQSLLYCVEPLVVLQQTPNYGTKQWERVQKHIYSGTIK